MSNQKRLKGEITDFTRADNLKKLISELQRLEKLRENYRKSNRLFVKNIYTPEDEDDYVSAGYDKDADMAIKIYATRMLDNQIHMVHKKLLDCYGFDVTTHKD